MMAGGLEGGFSLKELNVKANGVCARAKICGSNAWRCTKERDGMKDRGASITRMRKSERKRWKAKLRSKERCQVARAKPSLQAALHSEAERFSAE